MNKVWIIFKSEFINTVTRRSFLITLILVPLLPALILGGLSLFGEDVTEDSALTEITAEGAGVDGYVDLAGFIQDYPDWIEKDQLIAFESTESARAATQAGDIQGFYVISSDYIETGNLEYYLLDFNPFSSRETSPLIESLIQYNLLGSDQQRFESYITPAQLERVDLTPMEEELEEESSASYYVPYGVTLLFYFLTFSSASLLLNSIAKEKENRVMEILMNAVTPRQLLTGKILALGLVGLLQLVVWLSSGLVLLRLGGTTLNLPPSLQLPPTLIFWGVLFFIMGYLIYATLMAGVGALIPNIREASQATFMIIIPLMIPLVLASGIIEEPDGVMPLILSLVPFTATSTVMTRLAVSTVPLWQILTSLAIMALTFLFLIRAVAGMFQTQLLLTGQKFRIGVFIKYLFSREMKTLSEQNQT